MNTIIIASLVAAALVGTTSAVCDNTTASKVQECVFKSDLFVPANVPSNLPAVTSYCSGNATNNCLSTIRGDCVSDDRQLDLIKSMVTPERVMEGQMYLCENQTVLDGNYDCLQDLEKEEFQNCVKAAVGIITNVEPEAELKPQLDTMCTFFAAYSACFEGDYINADCQMVIQDSVQSAVNGIRYAYCEMDDAGKTSVVNAYTVGSASILSASVLTVLAAYMLSLFN